MPTKENDRTRRVAVTGLGVLAPGATNAAELGRLLRGGRSAITRIEAFDPSGYASKIAGQVSGYHGDWHSGRARWIRMAEDCAEQAIRDAALDADPARCGVSIATAVGATKLMAEHFADLTDEGEAPIDVAAAEEQLPGAATFNAASSAIADRYGFEGPCSTLTTGCTGGNDALGFAADLVRRGDADVMLAGASEATITPLVVACFDAIGALSVRNDEPERASRPFDTDRDGFVLGEGAAVVVLEELEHARARGAHVHCEITGFGSTANAFHMTDLEEHGEDLARSLEIALRDAGRRPEELDYVNAHGSSTPQNDVCETNAVKRVLGAAAYATPVSSIKGAIGHALAAANAIEFVATTVALEEGFLPPTLNLDEPDAACDLDYVPHTARPASVDIAASLSSGFGGIHSTIVLERAR
jgi:3-oxoacyl-(acyl-carrier-protein) synthase